MAILNPDSEPCVKGGNRHMTAREDRQGVKRRVCEWCGMVQVKTEVSGWTIIKQGDRVRHEGLDVPQR